MNQFKTKILLVGPDISTKIAGANNIISTIAIKETALVTLVSQGVVGDQGIQGIQGPIGPSGDISIVTSNVPISGHRVVVTIGNGLVEYASNENFYHQFSLLGVTENASAIGEEISVKLYGGISDPSFSFIQGPIFLGNDGMMIQAPPSLSPAVFSIIIGYAIDANNIYINIHQPINLI